MSRTAATRPWTPDEFLVWERQQPERHEWDGRAVIGMTGARLRHARVVRNVRNALEAQLLAGCEVFTEGLMLRAGDAVRYPDVVMICDTRAELDDIVVADATLVVEVLSPSSAATDRFAKVADYAHVPGLRAYLIVDPAERALSLYRREGTQLVPAAAAELAGETITLFEPLTLSLDAIYAGVL